MMLSSKMADDSNRVSMVKKHHEQANLNYNRPKYREARWERAVKVCDCDCVLVSDLDESFHDDGKLT